MPKGQFKRPEKYNTVVNYDYKITIRLKDKEKLEQIKAIAKEQDISYNKLIRDVLDNYIEEYNNKKLEHKLKKLELLSKEKSYQK